MNSRHRFECHQCQRNMPEGTPAVGVKPHAQAGSQWWRFCHPICMAEFDYERKERFPPELEDAPQGTPLTQPPGLHLPPQRAAAVERRSDADEGER